MLIRMETGGRCAPRSVDRCRSMDNRSAAVREETLPMDSVIRMRRMWTGAAAVQIGWVMTWGLGLVATIWIIPSNTDDGVVALVRATCGG